VKHTGETGHSKKEFNATELINDHIGDFLRLTLWDYDGHPIKVLSSCNIVDEQWIEIFSS
jgi:F-type H+-transporting ATPase subunit a